MLRWHSDVKNHEIWTFNFLCQKSPNLSDFFFIEEYQYKTSHCRVLVQGNKQKILWRFETIFGLK